MHMLTLPRECEDIRPAVLDARKGRLFETAKADDEQTVLLKAHARTFVERYKNL